MIRRTTIELDEDLLNRAKRALHAPTTRATVEEALRRVVAAGEVIDADRVAKQATYLRRLKVRVDPAVLDSEQMWR